MLNVIGLYRETSCAKRLIANYAHIILIYRILKFLTVKS